jgi:hypothetical protein
MTNSIRTEHRAAALSARRRVRRFLAAIMQTPALKPTHGRTSNGNTSARRSGPERLSRR